METRDLLFLGVLAMGVVVLLSLTTRAEPDNLSTIEVPDDTEIVGMSLAPECDPPSASPFKGRYVYPPPLMAMLPTVGNA